MKYKDMRTAAIFLLIVGLYGCKAAPEHAQTAVLLSVAGGEVSKTEALTVGEEIAVFACAEGTEDYFLEAAKFIVDADGWSLNYGSAVYYPDPKEAVRFFAYFPYHIGTFNVPMEQSTTEALKQADLCGAVASSTPVATPVSLEFRHLLARLVITTNEPTTKIVFPNAIASGVVHAATAEFILADTRSEVWTTGNELIVPVQPLSRLVLTVSGVEYVFDGSVSLEAGKTTTLDLTLHPDTKTATLSGSSVADWGSVGGEGNPSPAVSNTLLLHWPSYLPQGAAPDQVVFTIGGTDYTVSSGISYANRTFIVPFASSVLRYPYTITNIAFYQSGRLVQSCANLIGATSYKSGTMTVGINPSAIRIGDLIWATGNLVASNATAGERGEGGCRIGAPADGGLYFQFGSLIGWKGGALANGGTGGGMPLRASNGTYWGGAAAWSWANDAMVWPTNLADNPTSWPQGATTNQWYFGLQTGWGTDKQNIRDFPNFATGGLANVGVGDPCSYYLGGTWRLPITAEYVAVCNDAVDGSWETADGSWTTSPVNGGNLADNQLFFPASGYREHLYGWVNLVTTRGYSWSSSVRNATYGYILFFYNTNVVSQGSADRSHGFPVRCVSSVQ